MDIDESKGRGGGECDTDDRELVHHRLRQGMGHDFSLSWPSVSTSCLMRVCHMLMSDDRGRRWTESLE